MKNFYVYVVGALFLGTLALGITTFVVENDPELVYADPYSGDDNFNGGCGIGPCRTGEQYDDCTAGCGCANYHCIPNGTTYIPPTGSS